MKKKGEMAEKKQGGSDDDFQAFLRVLRRAMLIIVTWMEVRYGWRRSVLSDLDEPTDE